MFKSCLSKLFVFIFSHAFFVNFVLLQKRCYTPDQYLGTCVKLTNCEHLLSLRQKTSPTHEDRLFMSLSVCGFINSNPLVCCSHESTYPRMAIEVQQNTAFTFQTSIKSSDLLPDPSVCAAALEERIFGGVEAKIDEFPFSALLIYTRANSNSTNYEFNCGGSLISNRFVLTAAHCISQKILLPRNWELKKVRLGEYNLITLLDCGEGVSEDYVCAPAAIDIDIEQQFIHEDFNANRHNDIGLLKLKNDVKFNKFVRPICLPHNLLINTDYTNFIVSGYGRTESGKNSNVRLKTNVRGVNNEECQVALSAKTTKTIVGSQLCALGIDGKDSCQGDSGNGLIYINTKSSQAHWVLMGIVSFGSIPCGSDIPGVYTRVSDFIPWIVSKM